MKYKQITDFNLENFALQKRMIQSADLENEEERNKIVSQVYKDLGSLQNRIMIAGIEQVETPTGVVTEHGFITEWIENAERSIFEAVKEQVNKNNDTWRLPPTKIKCENCSAENAFTIDLDQSSFFASA